jgi:hypothetical protein
VFKETTARGRITACDRYSVTRTRKIRKIERRGGNQIVLRRSEAGEGWKKISAKRHICKAVRGEGRA